MFPIPINQQQMVDNGGNVEYIKIRKSDHFFDEKINNEMVENGCCAE